MNASIRAAKDEMLVDDKGFPMPSPDFAFDEIQRCLNFLLSIAEEFHQPQKTGLFGFLFCLHSHFRKPLGDLINVPLAKPRNHKITVSGIAGHRYIGTQGIATNHN